MTIDFILSSEFSKNLNNALNEFNTDIYMIVDEFSLSYPFEKFTMNIIYPNELRTSIEVLKKVSPKAFRDVLKNLNKRYNIHYDEIENKKLSFILTTDDNIGLLKGEIKRNSIDIYMNSLGMFDMFKYYSVEDGMGLYLNFLTDFINMSFKKYNKKDKEDYGISVIIEKVLPLTYPKTIPKHLIN